MKTFLETIFEPDTNITDKSIIIFKAGTEMIADFFSVTCELCNDLI